MSKVTTLPFMEAELFADSIIDQYRFFCELCEYRTARGSFYDCEMEAAGHLDEAHPEQRKAADEEVARKRRELYGG